MISSILALAFKDIRLLVRDRIGFFFTFGFPILYAMLFGLIFSGAAGGDGDGASALPVIVIDEDRTDGSRQFVDALVAAEELDVQELEARDDGEQMVRRGRRTAAIIVTEGFGDASERMFYGDPARIEVLVDPARRAESGMLQGILTKYGFAGMQEMFADTGAMQDRARASLDAVDEDEALPEGVRGPLRRFLGSLDAFAVDLEQYEAQEEADGEAAGPGADWQPVVIDVVAVTAPRAAGSGPPSAFAISFPQAIVWGVMGCAAAFGISLVIERRSGTLVRLCAAPLRRREILLGKASACFMMTLTVAIMLLLLASAVGVRPALGDLPKLAIAVLCVCACFTGIMMLLSTLGRTEAAAGGIGWAVLLVLAMIGGGMIPLFIMPGWMQSAASISPVKWGILSLEGALWRGYSPAEMLLPCGILLAVGAIAFALGCRLFRWE